MLTVYSCDECLRLHGATASNATRAGSSGRGYQFIPSAFVRDLSSAYCAMPTATLNYEEFAKNFTITHPVSYGTATGGVDLLKGKTAVSNYFTSSPIMANTTSSSSMSAAARTGGTQSQSSSHQPTTSTRPAPTNAAGGVANLKIPGILGIGFLGVAWVL